MAMSFAELHRAVVFGRSGGRIIWQPRILRLREWTRRIYTEH